MAKTRFFQHLNENNSDFQKVTTLDIIDDSGDMVMYYFKDGSKCNKNYIAPVNADSIEGFEFAEVSDPKNVWKLKKIEPILSQERPKPAVGDNGVVYEAPSLEEYTQTQKHAKTRIEVVGRPMKIEGYEAPSDSDYYYDPATYGQDEVFDFNDKKETKKPVKENITQTKTIAESNIGAVTKISNDYHIDINHILNSSKIVLHFPDGKTCEMNPSEFIENAITPKEEKIVEKVVEKEVIVKTSDTDIDLGVDNNQKALIDNMIDMSNKVDYSFEIDLTLNLPPTSVYKLIKTVYPEGMAKGFVNILANRMQIKELKSSVAEGLLAFYDEDLAIEENEAEEPESKVIKRNTRVKKEPVK